VNGYEPPVVVVNPFRRTWGGLTWMTYDEVRGDTAIPGRTVVAANPQNGCTAPAVVVRLNRRRERIYLAVPWKELERKP
jgi:hypothetical protein